MLIDMRRSFVALFRDIVLLGIPLAGSHCEGTGEDCACHDHEARFEVERDDLQFWHTLAACEASPSDCLLLCQSARTTKASHVKGETISTVSCVLVPIEDGGIDDGSTSSDAATDAGRSPARQVVATYRACPLPCGSGRFPTAAANAPAFESGPPGRSRADWFRAMARLETASVVAFQELARELEAHRAPQVLIDAAWRARRDEIRHATLAASLAGQSRAAPQEFEETLGRSLEELAILNASEGCVRETFGALVATHQAHHAADTRVRSALAEIAADESRHAELAWKLRAWFDGRLDAPARARIAEAEQVAWALLEESLAQGPPDHVAADIGLPSRATSQYLFRELRRALSERPRLARTGRAQRLKYRDFAR